MPSIFLEGRCGDVLLQRIAATDLPSFATMRATHVDCRCDTRTFVGHVLSTTEVLKVLLLMASDKECLVRLMQYGLIVFHQQHVVSANHALALECLN